MNNRPKGHIAKVGIVGKLLDTRKSYWSIFSQVVLAVEKDILYFLIFGFGTEWG